MQIPLRLDAKGQLLPVQRQIVFAPLHGKVIDLKVRNGDRVDKGQEILLIEDLDTQLQVDLLAFKIGSAEQRIALLNEQIGKSTNNEERNTLAKDRINQEYEMRKAIAERDILLQGSRSPRKSPVFAPLAGKIVTLPHPAEVTAVAFGPGNAILTGCVDGQARLWRANAGTYASIVLGQSHEGGVRAVAFNWAGILCATGGDDKRIGLWDEWH